MKFQIMLEILFTLLARKRVIAREFADRYGISLRSVYRYVDELTVAGIPIDVARGSQGGIYISDTYKLPRGFFTKEEYRAATNAILAMHEQLGSPLLKNVADKLSAQFKSEKFDVSLSGNILVDSGTWGDERKFSEKLTLIEQAVNQREALFIDYSDRDGNNSKRTILPHLLVYKQNIWYTYAWCKTRNDFRLFKLGRMRSVVKTGETFERIPFSREQIPLSFWTNEENTVNARFEILAEALPFAEEWLGVENIRKDNGSFYADVILPDDDSLVGKILSAGAGFRVLSPASLALRVKAEALRIAKRC